MTADLKAYFDEVEARFDGALDFTVGLEEEFQILAPETLELTPGFEELRDAAGSRLAERIAGELIRSEIEVRTPRTASLRPGRAPPAPEPRRALQARRRARVRAGGHGHPPVLELARPGDHRHPALSARRGAPQVRRLAQQHVERSRPHRRARQGPRGRRLRRSARVPAAPARTLGQLALHRGRVDAASLRAHADLRAHVPALRGTRHVRRLGGASALLRDPGRDELHRGVHPGLVVDPAAPPLRDGRGAHLRRADRTLAGARRDGARRGPHGRPRARLRRGPAARRRKARATSRRTSGARSASASTASWSTGPRGGSCRRRTRSGALVERAAPFADGLGLVSAPRRRRADAARGQRRPAPGAGARGRGDRSRRCTRGRSPGRAPPRWSPRRRPKSGRPGERGATRAATSPEPEDAGDGAGRERRGRRGARPQGGRRVAPPEGRGPCVRYGGQPCDGGLPEARTHRADARAA